MLNSPKTVTTQVKEILRKEHFIRPKSLLLRSAVSLVKLPLSTELIHRHFVYGSYFQGYKRLERLHVVLMTNLKAFSTDSNYSEVIVVFENDYSQIVKCDPQESVSPP